MGENRWSGIEEQKRNEREAKAGDRVPKAEKGDGSSRLQASKAPSEDEEKHRVVEKLEGSKEDS